MAKRITVDQLAVMVADGFQTVQDEVRGRFAVVVDELKDIKVELKDLRADVGRVERKLNSAIEQLDDHSIRLRRLEDSAQG